MNREILYCGKRIDNGEWVEGYFIETENPVYRAFIISSIDIDVHSCGMDILDSEIFEVIPETVGEYTGLTDENGKKIFENDILLGAWHTKLIVYYDDCYLGFRAREVSGRENDISYYDNGKLEVIGNIHDNPELLEIGNGNG